MRIDFFNEEEQGIWRVATRARRVGQLQDEIFGMGMLTTAMPRQPGFVSSDFAGLTLRSDINTQQCGGPFGSIQNQVPSSLNPLCFPVFGWQFNADGTAFNVPFPPPNPNRLWSMMTGANQGQIYIESRTGAGMSLISVRRAWQKVRTIGNRTFVLEDFEILNPASATPPPFVIGRADRLNELAPYPN